MTWFTICPECRGKGWRLKPYVAKAVEELCPQCGGKGLRKEEGYESD